MEFKGILKEKGEIKTGIGKTGNPWQSRQFRCETLEEYAQIVIFDLYGDKCDLIEKIPVGVAVTVSFNFKANESNGTWWNKINAWKVESDYKTTNQTTQVQKVEEPKKDDPIDPTPDNQLPF